MGERLIDLLVNGMKRLHVALGRFWKRYTTPPGDAERKDTYTDQW